MSKIYKSFFVQMKEEDNPADQQENKADEQSAASLIQDKIRAGEKIIDEANEEAIEILRGAAIEAEAIKTAAQKEAMAQSDALYESTYNKALEDANNRLETERAAAAIQAQQIIDEAQLRRTAIIDGVEESCIALTYSIISKILHYEIKTNRQAIEGLISNALRHLRDPETAKTRISQEDFDRFFSEGQVKVQTDDGVITVPVSADPALESGDCFVDSDQGSINAGVNSQLDKITENLDGVSS